MRTKSLTALSLVLSACACGPSSRDGLGDKAAEVDAAAPDAAQPDAAVIPDPPPPADCEPCQVTGPGIFCGLTVDIDPFVTGGTFGGFQSDPGTGESHLITIGLSAPINWISVRIMDPDFDGNSIRTYDGANNLISSFDFPSDGVAQAYTEEMGGIGGSGIERVELVPAPADYVAYDELMVVPEGCGPPPVQ